jgi:ATP-binding cassette subfamily C (CFTR/MRP) protein 1
MFLPRALSAIADARNALERLTVVFEAETLVVANAADPTLDIGIRVTDASFEWLVGEAPVEEGTAKGDRKQRKKAKQLTADPNAADEKAPAEAAPPFRVEGLNMGVKRGAITVLAGRVGSGKSSILQGLIGDMRKTSPDGKVSVLSFALALTLPPDLTPWSPLFATPASLAAASPTARKRPSSRTFAPVST